MANILSICFFDVNKRKFYRNVEVQGTDVKGLFEETLVRCRAQYPEAREYVNEGDVNFVGVGRLSAILFLDGNKKLYYRPQTGELSEEPLPRRPAFFN